MAGEECMVEEELEKYYAGVEVFITYLDTKIDFEDIETPLKTALKFSSFAINPRSPIGEILDLK